ncbi:MAG: uracil-DNA glycosylase [Coraliomargaritaceae bacterium]
MQDSLDAIRQELKRLHLEGVERVYVENTTLEEVAQRRSVETVEEPSNRTDILKQVSGDQEEEPTIASAFPPPPVLSMPESDATSQMKWLQKTVLDCPTTREQLGTNAKIVFGQGDVQSDLFFCGEAPTQEEARCGRPFVGQAGELLEKIISAMGLEREQVYLTNILHWRPDYDEPNGNRLPTADEMKFSLPYLKAQIQIVQPKVIIAMGNTALSGLLGPDPNRRMASIRGTWLEFEGIPLMATFHPSYLLRRNDNTTKRQVWEDLLLVMKKAGLPISEKQQSYFLPKT